MPTETLQGNTPVMLDQPFLDWYIKSHQKSNVKKVLNKYIRDCLTPKVADDDTVENFAEELYQRSHNP